MRRWSAVAAAVLASAALTAGAGSVVPAAAATDAAADASSTTGTCAEGHGVTVVVEPAALGGKAEVACDPDGGGRTADRIFADTGHRLARVSSSPDFVCKVDGRPANASCAQVPPADAYWSLWSSDGTSPWTYATIGVDGLTVPDGGAVAFTWVDGNGDGTPVTQLAGANRSSASPSPRGVVTDPDQPPVADSDEGGLPGWVPPVVVVAVLGAAAALILARPKRRP